jgi:signal transduction histidine kinase
MSHELNTPLNAVVGLADVLKTELARPGLDPSFADMVGLIGQSGEHISRIVSDVLEIADGDSAPVALDRLDPADLGACVQAAVDAATPHAKSNGVRIGWDRPQAGIGVLFDPQELTQSVGKLLDNAVKFNRPGGAVKLRLLPADPATGAPARLDVADTGIGIPADQLERIREPFVQVDQGYSRAVDGTGLGLCIVDRSATRHGARLHIHSVPDRGSVFSLLFAPTPNSVSGSVSASDPATDTPSERLDTAA